jgi:hypothetical protein
LKYTIKKSISLYCESDLYLGEIILRLLWVFGLLIVVIITVTPGSARPVYYSGTGNYYEVISAPTGITWMDAKHEAESRFYSGVQGHLATITAQGENDFIIANLGGNNIKGCWIGGIQPVGSQEPDGGWQWVTSEPWGYTNWIGPPNNHYGGDQGIHPYGYPENAVQINWWDDSGTWNDFPDDIPMYGYIVEYETKQNPRSGSTIFSIPSATPKSELISSPSAACSIVGYWQRTDGFDSYIMFEEGTAQTQHAQGPINTGTWVNNNAIYTLSWTHGPRPGEFYIDTVTMSPDCNSWEGTNNYGEAVHSVRTNIQLPDAAAQYSASLREGNWFDNWFNNYFNPILNPIKKIISWPSNPVFPNLPIPTIQPIPYNPAPIPTVQPIPYRPAPIPTVQPIPYRPAPIPIVQPIPYRPAPIQPIQPVQPIPPFNPRF